MHFNYCKPLNLAWLSRLELLNTKYRLPVRMMKITAFILLVGCLHASAHGISQTVSISEKNAPMTKIFKLIEKQTAYVFFYDVDWVKNTKSVTVNVKNIALQSLLDLIFKDQPITYKITGNIINITRKKNDAKEDEQGMATPPLNLHGKVIDESGKAVPGVTVTVKGTKKQVVTDENGEFTMSGVESDALLSFSSVNMESFEIKVAGQSEILAKLKTKTSQLDEVQIIAYGQVTKRFQTGNVATVKAKDIEKQPVTNPLLALQGQVPGLVISQSTGMSGTAVKVRVQGQNSITGGNDPLFVIDGVPFLSQLPAGVGIGSILGTGAVSNGAASYGNPFSYLNPSDIESVEVLKDADATAIYGSRAANGAILITTKKGKSGKTRVDVNLQSGRGKVTRKMDLLNTDQYFEMRHEALKNDGIASPSSTDYDINGLWDANRYTDWQKTLIGGESVYSNANVNVSGGTPAIQYYVAGNYHRETTVFPNSFADSKSSMHFNLSNAVPNEKFHFQISANYLADKNELPNVDLTGAAVTLAPNAPALYNSDGSLNWAPTQDGTSSWSNPLSYLANRYKNRAFNLISNALVGYKVLPGLEIKSSFGYTNLQTKELITVPMTSILPEDRPYALRSSVFGNSLVNSWIAEPQLSYKIHFAEGIFKGHLDALIGTTIQEINSEGAVIYADGFNSDVVLGDLKAAAGVYPGSTLASVYKYNALFGKLNYILGDEFIIDLTVRRDGSSRFGEKNQFHNFGAGAFAWIFTKEKLVKQNLAFISFGKFRASYGTTGNDQIGDYSFLNLYSPVNVEVAYQNQTGLRPNGLSNPYLQWEQTKKLQFGIDLGLFKDRILLYANYYNNRSSNELLPYALPVTTGFSNIIENFPATVRNSGWEFSLNLTNLKKRDFTWNTSFNITIPKNKLLAFPNLDKSQYANSLVVGEPITLRKVYHLLKVDPSTGTFQFEDAHGASTSSPSYLTDRKVLINTSPTLYGGVGTTLSYKGISLDIFLQFVKQKGPNYFFGNIPGYRMTNQPAWVLQRWQKTGDVTNVQRYNSTYSLGGQFSNASNNSDVAWSDASYTRLKNVSLSWQIPFNWAKKAEMQSLRIYMQGQNLLTFTDYKGLDPETLSSTTLPPLRMFIVGIQASF